MRKSLAILGFVVVLVIGARLWLAPEHEDPWAFKIDITVTDETNPFTEARLQARLEHVNPLVEEVVGQSIRLDELRLVVADGFVAAERELRASYPHLVDPAHQDYAVVPLVLTSTSLQELWGSLLGRYVPETKTIELYPFAFEALKPEDMGALIDVVFAHELAHVWQDQRYRAFEHEGVGSTTESDLALAAVVEGTAEFISRAVARRLDAEQTFNLVASKRDAQGATETRTASQQSLARWRRWAYGEGLLFVEAIHAKLGPGETWSRLFEDTPGTVWSIEHPNEWIEHPETSVADLDTWASRLLWTQEAVRPRFVFQRRWGYRPLLRDDIEERLASAGLLMASASWSRCQGGVLFVGTPKRGPMAGTSFLMRAWRFPTPGEAGEARLDLERAFDAMGPRVWSGADVEEALGSERLLRRPNGAVVRTSLVFDDARLHAHEGAWGLQVHDSILFEVVCRRDGIGPALLDLLDASVAALVEGETIDAAMAGAPGSDYSRLRDLRADQTAEAATLASDGPAPLRDELLARRLAAEGGKSAVLDWLLDNPDSITAWMTALGPAAGQEDQEGVEKGGILDAALAHEDDRVKRFALGAMADRRCHLPPWSAHVIPRVAALTTHEDPWMRSAAVRAAEAIAEQKPLPEARIDALASDASPAVRAALAVSRELQGRRKRLVLRQLAADPHPAVKRAAEAEAADQQDGTDSFVDQMMEIAKRYYDEKVPAKEDERVDQAAAFQAVIEAMMTDSMGKNQDELVRRVRRFLVEGDEAVRVLALLSLQFLGEERERFLPELIRAFDSAMPRRVATMALCKGGLDLNPAREHLLSMLEHPWWRADVLRTMAANEIDLPPEVWARARAWLGSPDPLLRTAAALLLLRDEAGREQASTVLDVAWSGLPAEWRVLVLAAATTHRPDGEGRARMRSEALCSGFIEERNAVFNAREAGVFNEAHLRTLLDGMSRAGPVVAEEYWSHFLDAADDFKGEDRERARQLLAEYLDLWQSSGGLPRITSSGLWRVGSPGLGESQIFVEALDRCLLDRRTSTLKYALAFIRSEVDSDQFPESPRVRDAVNRLLSLAEAPEDFPRFAENDFIEVLGDRDGVDARVVRAVLLRVARAPSEGESYIDIEAFIQGHPERTVTAIKLVPELLDMGTDSSVSAAIEVLDVAGPEAKHVLPKLRGLAARALPTWRTRIERVILGIERDD